MQSVWLSILPFFLVIGFGAFMASVGLAKDHWVDILGRYGLYVGFPALIFEGLATMEKTAFEGMGQVALWNLVITVGFLFLVLAVSRLLGLSRTLSNTLAIGGFFGNVAYLGHPVITSVLPGSDGQVSVVIAVYTLVLFTFGIGILELSQKKMTEKRPGDMGERPVNTEGRPDPASPRPSLGAEILRTALRLISNPLLVAALTGLLWGLYGPAIPGTVMVFLDTVAASASPVVMFALGIFFVTRVRLTDLSVWLPVMILLKMAVLPLLALLVFRGFFGGQPLAISVLEAGMPMALTPFALASEYDMDAKLLSIGILVTTILGMVSLPLLFSLT
ncbi:MAG: AEC family transporter [Spirochaetales bacterium]|nr:AEC family transporter [Spirochaetales bacterium]MCF7939413.1 AEC family transporter [Spirochaetales bacterium]